MPFSFIVIAFAFKRQKRIFRFTKYTPKKNYECGNKGGLILYYIRFRTQRTNFGESFVLFKKTYK